MTSWRDDIKTTLSDFVTVSELARDPIRRDEIEVEFLDAPHRAPSRLPVGKMAIYGFWRDGEWLKIGKAGPKSQARYTSQHYGLNAMSTLAKTLIKAHAVQPFAGFDPEIPGDWIRASTHRVNILIDAERGNAMLSLIEAFLHARLKPRYEG